MTLPINIKAQNILIAGAGGGYDVFAGLAIGIDISTKNKNVYYANYSFTNLAMVENANWITENCLKISDQSKLKEGNYFPERLLSEYLKNANYKNNEIYCYNQIGVSNLKSVFEYLVEMLNIDCIIIVDGGCDGIFRGDEFDLGTPSMDSISIIAGSLCSVREKYYVLSAFGSEGANHEVSHADALQRISDLTKAHKYLGVCSLLPQDNSTKQFLECIDFTYKRILPQQESNIISSIVASIQGKFGLIAVTSKIEHAPIWISPLTSLLWFFDLEGVAKLKLFYSEVLETKNVAEVAKEIEKHRPITKAKRINIPI